MPTLQETFRLGEGLIVVTGDAEARQRYLDRAQENCAAVDGVQVVRLVAEFRREADMLTALCAALGFPPERGAGRCWDALRAHMQRSEANADYALVLLIDNGETLNQDMFDVVKAFWNWFPDPLSGDHARRMAHIILAGDPALIRNLRAAKDKSLLSRVGRHVKV